MNGPEQSENMKYFQKSCVISISQSKGYPNKDVHGKTCNKIDDEPTPSIIELSYKNLHFKNKNLNVRDYLDSCFVCDEVIGLWSSCNIKQQKNITQEKEIYQVIKSI